MPEESVNEEYIPRLLKYYRETVVPELMGQLSYKNKMQVPRLNKIVLNMGLGQAVSDSKIVEKAVADLSLIAGQRAKITRARKPISNFKIRKGMAIGCCVALRRYRMYEFLDRFITVAVPRIRDFRGFSPHAFDDAGNFTLGLSDQTVFPEINIDKVEKTLGMNITICTTSSTDVEALALMRALGFPFKR